MTSANPIDPSCSLTDLLIDYAKNSTRTIYNKVRYADSYVSGNLSRIGSNVEMTCIQLCLIIITIIMI